MSDIRRSLFAYVLLSASLGAQGTVVSNAAGFGSTSADPLTITGTWTIVDGSTIDFLGREVIVAAGAVINVQNATLLCGRLTTQSSSTITGTNAGILTVGVAAALGHDGSMSVNGDIEHSSAGGGGSVAISTTGGFSIGGSGRIRARGTTISADGGCIAVTAIGAILINGASISLDATSGNDGLGGKVTLTSTAASVSVQKRIAVDGGSFGGGCADLVAATTLNSAGLITADGGGSSSLGFGCGGFVTLLSGGTATVSSDIRANGPTGNLTDGGGFGGGITMDVAGILTITANCRADGGICTNGGCITITAGTYQQTSGVVSARGAGADSSGGMICIATPGTASLGSNHDVSGDSGFASGGCFTLSAGGDIFSLGNIFAHGNCGGFVTLCSDAGSIVHSGRVEDDGRGSAGFGGSTTFFAAAVNDLRSGFVNASGANAGGQGGCITIESGFHFIGDATTNILADSNGAANGLAGSICISGCRVTLPSGSHVEARGAVSGNVTITGGDVVTLGGFVRAPSGSVDVITRLAMPFSPVILGTATIVPAPIVQTVPTLPPCLGRLSTAFTSNGPVSIGTSPTLSLQIASSPNKALVVLANLTTAYEPLGALGWAQLSLTGSLKLADPGILGPPLVNSATDMLGNWSASYAVPFPGLVGLTLLFEAYVVDFGAENGLFHQTPLLPVTFVP